MRFQGKRVLITGAASGIGRSAALRIAEEGAELALLDFDADSLEKTAEEIQANYQTRVEISVCDVANHEQVTAEVTRLIKTLGGIHALSHNAGIMRAYHTHEMTLEQWNQLIAVNLTGTFSVNKAALPFLLENETSYLVNMSSIAEHHPHPWLAAYAATKGAIHSFTRSLFIEYHRQGLRANCVKPGSIQTDLAKSFSVPEGADPSIAQYLTPYGAPHMVAPTHAAAAIAFLCSDDAYHVNGSEIVVDGGKI